MMNIERGAVIVLVCENGKAVDLLATLTQQVKNNVIEVYNRKIEMTVPENMNLNEAVANAFVDNGTYKVSKIVNAQNTLHVFYTPDEYRSQVHQDNQRLAADLFNVRRG